MARQKYVIPKFHDLALVVLSYGVIEVTARQLTLILLSGFVVLNLWPDLSDLPLMARAVVAGLPALLILPFGWISIQGRPLETWLFVLLRYWSQPKIYHWQQFGTATTTRHRHTTQTTAIPATSKESEQQV
jgi:hypothetical protein